MARKITAYLTRFLCRIGWHGWQDEGHVRIAGKWCSEEKCLRCGKRIRY